LRRPHAVQNALAEPLGRLESILKEAKKRAENQGDEAQIREFDGYASRCEDSRENLHELLEQSRPGHVYWAQIQPRPGDGRSNQRVPRIALCAAPIEVADGMQKTLFGAIKPVILTSATLTTGGNFEFLRERLGLVPEKCETPVETLTLGSPFNYQDNALLYVARDLPDPSNAALFEKAAVKRAAQVVQATNGRAFVLCTSFRTVDAAAVALRAELPKKIRVLKQGEAPRGKLLDEFRRDVHSVLVGTTSFWQGVDVPGESLSCVVMMKLPFAVPDDPLVQARVENLREQKRDAFNEYQVPQAVMMFRQGFGRLIRTRTDRGIVAVLDPRLVTKQYGQTFLKSLPDCTVVEELDELKNWFEV
jgi:ATP-dependent DNA helicase DinG